MLTFLGWIVLGGLAYIVADSYNTRPEGSPSVHCDPNLPTVPPDQVIAKMARKDAAATAPTSHRDAHTPARTPK